MEKIAASGRAPESFDIFAARNGTSFAIPSEHFSADMQAGLKDMGLFQTQVASAEEAVAPAAAETSNSFQGDGGFSYTFEPETGNYVITAAPEDYAHLTGVTVRPGSNAYDSIQAEHQTGQSLYQAESQAEAPVAPMTPTPAEIQYAAPADDPRDAAMRAAFGPALAEAEAGEKRRAEQAAEAEAVPASWSDPIRSVMGKLRSSGSDLGSKLLTLPREAPPEVRAEREARRAEREARREAEGSFLSHVAPFGFPLSTPKE